MNRHFVLSLVLWVVWLVLLAVYADTVYHVPAGYRDAILVLGLLVILYFAEGMEIAVATLADKQASQLEREPAKKALAYIKRDAEWFFSQRQVFVVTIVSFMSLMTTFPVVHVPFYGPMGAHDYAITVGSFSIAIDVPFWFTLVFTSFTILWWCQVFPKRLALRNSETFLSQSAILMHPIRIIGAINLPGPADQLVWFASKYTSYKNQSSLKPGRSYYYDTAVMLYGCVVDRMTTTVGIAADGSTTVTQRALLLCIHGSRSSTSGRVTAESDFLSAPNISIVALYSCPLPEKLESIATQLGSIFDGQDPAQGLLTRHDLQNWNFDHQFTPVAGAKEVTWSTDWGAPLPDRLRPPGQTHRSHPTLSALLYEVTTQFGPGAYAKDDYFEWTNQMPCRRFTLRVQSSRGARIRFGMRKCVASLRSVDFVDETDRGNQIIKNSGLSNSFDMEFPMQGTTYRINWEGWPT